MDSNRAGCIVVGLSAAGLLWFLAARSSGGKLEVPKYEDSGVSYSGLNSTTRLDSGEVGQEEQCTGYEWHMPRYDPACQKYVKMRHRYPKVSGSNFSAVIHHGFDAMRLPSPEDNAWRVQPPSEVML